MPNVNGKKYPYTSAGIQAAKNAQLKKLANQIAKKKPGPGGLKDAPKQNPNGGLYGPIGKKPIAKKPRNGIIKLDPRESNGGFNKKPKPIMTTLPSKSSKTKKM